MNQETKGPETMHDTSDEPPKIKPLTSADLESSLARLDQHFADFRSDYKIPGLSYGVVYGGDLIWANGFGDADLQNSTPATTDSVFRIASMTKSFTAMCVLMLRDEGRLRLDDLASNYLSELRSLRPPTSDAPQMTIRSLLTMSSGLVEDDPWGDRLLALPGSEFRQLLDGGLVFDLDPQCAFEYSNLGFAILGQIIEEVAGIPLRDFATTHIFDPLGMESTTLDADLISPEHRAVGYSLLNNEYVEEPSLGDGAFGAMGGIASSVRDMGRYLAFHLAAWPPRDDADPGPIKRSSLREMAQIHRVIAPDFHPPLSNATTSVDGYGYGLFSAYVSNLGHIISHSGGLPGFGSHMAWIPERDIGIVVLGNRTYRPLKDAVMKGFGLLVDAGIAPQSPPTPSQWLLRTKEAIAVLYERWSSDLESQTFLDTYPLDRDDQRCAPNFQLLREHYGSLLGTGDIHPTGALRGSWEMQCEKGSFLITAMLGPTPPPRVQYLRITDTTNTSTDTK